MEILLNICAIDDSDVLRELSIKTYYETFSSMNTPENMEAYLEQAFDRKKLIHELSDTNSLFLLLKKDDKPIGYLKVNEAPSQTDINDENALEIERIYVSKEFKGEGMGKYLMKHAIKIAIKRRKNISGSVFGRKTKRLSVFIRSRVFIKLENILSLWVMMSRRIISCEKICCNSNTAGVIQTWRLS